MQHQRICEALFPFLACVRDQPIPFQGKKGNYSIPRFHAALAPGGAGEGQDGSESPPGLRRNVSPHREQVFFTGIRHFRSDRWKLRYACG